MAAKIKGTEAAWDNRKLGNSKPHARKVDSAIEAAIESKLAMQAISLRLSNQLIEAFKTLGQFHGIGYQPLMRDALQKFAESEMKAVVSGVISSQRKAKRVEKKAA